MAARRTRALFTARWMALLIPAALLGGAYVGQYVYGLYPCEMCWWQRYPHFAALALALLAFAVKGGAARACVILAGLAILISGLIGGFPGPVLWAELGVSGRNLLKNKKRTTLRFCG